MSLASRRELALIWILRVVAIATAVGHLLGGDPIYGAYTVVAVAIALVPAVLARTTRATWPVEVELVYLWFLISDMTLGQLAGLYLHLSWYDKALHFGNAILIGIVAFFGVYVSHYVARFPRRPWLDGIAILLATLGLGALWEIGEYGVDTLFGYTSQGSPVQGAIDDTMWDLILDGLGGMVGAVLGPLYMHGSQRSRQRLLAVGELIEDRQRRRAARRAGLPRRRGANALRRPGGSAQPARPGGG